MDFTKTPKELNYRFPAEWEKHRATWLSWPHNKDSWPGKIETIYPIYSQFIKILTAGEQVCINVNNEEMKRDAIQHLNKQDVDLSKVDFFIHPTNDAWCRDHGPSFLINHSAANKKVIIDWQYNAWGGKYPPYDLDNATPASIAKELALPVFKPGIVMEGGSVDFNGKGTLLTTTACLLNPNRNPALNQREIEQYLKSYYAVENILWLSDGIVGDDTDGHIDDITRFVSSNTVVSAIEHNKADDNYQLLKSNIGLLEQMKIENGERLNIIELPMPAAVTHNGQRLPASYANFYISNNAVIVPIFRDKNDDKALEIIQNCFTDRKVVGLDSSDIIWGLGSFHCLSQQEPECI